MDARTLLLYKEVVSDESLKNKLNQLLGLAILRPDESEDRKNEARNAAFLLFQLCHEKGISIKFTLPGTKSAEPKNGDANGNSKKPVSRKNRVRQDDSPPMYVVSKKGGACVACGARYSPGERVWFKHGAGCTHETCGWHALQF